MVDEHVQDDDLRIELESRVAFQDKHIAELNDALVDQTKTVLELCRRVERLEKVILGLNQQLETLVERPPHEKPPHY